MRTPAGYRHPAYAESLREFGTPRRLGGCGGSVLVRAIPGTDRLDALGPYPLFACDDWPRLADDLAALGAELASVTVVADPFGGWSIDDLDRAFPDLRRPFKEHSVVELGPDPLRRVSAHHQRRAARGLRHATVELVGEPPTLLSDWLYLYERLIARHSITGIAAFSPAAFETQLRVPGIVAFRATSAGETLGASLWYVDGAVAYWHLSAFSERAYKVGASFALMASALEHFAATDVRWLALGAGAGLTTSPTDGLAQFKAGWATGSRTAHLCGRVLDRATYDELTARRPPAIAHYFPAYRAVPTDTLSAR